MRRSKKTTWPPHAPAKKPRVAFMLPSILLIAAVSIATRLGSGTNPACQETAVPSYFYPGADWTKAISSRPVPSIMILDITSSGAGSSPDPNYHATVKRAQAAGIRIIGYSNTDYTQRPAAAVETDVKNYKAWYNVTDIFLDEAASNSSSIPYYRQLTGYIRNVSPRSMVILNPGTYPDRGYMSLGDVVMTYENTYANYVNLQVPSWTDKYPSTLFAHAVYATSNSQLANAISLSKRRNAGYVYVTNGTGPNPYSSLPSYWSREDAIISSRCHEASP